MESNESKYKYNNMDPLANAYLKVITESSDDLQKTGVAKTDLKIGTGAFGHEDKNAKTFIKKSGPESEGAEDTEDCEEAPAELTQSKVTDGKPSKNTVSYEAKNPFDVLYNKILSEEGEFEFSTGSKPEDSSFDVAEPFGAKDAMDSDENEFGEEGEEGEDEEVTFTLDRETAQKLLDVLTTVLGEEEHEAGESEEEESEEHEEGGEEEGEESSEGEEENPFKEATDMEALADEKGLSLTEKGKKEVKSAVPVTKKSAQTPSTGKGHDGKLKAHSTDAAISKLTGKSNDTGGVRTGKFLVAND